MPRFLLEVDVRVNGKPVEHKIAFNADDVDKAQEIAKQEVMEILRADSILSAGVELSELNKIQAFNDFYAAVEAD